jgi:hypothetical protein
MKASCPAGRPARHSQCAAMRRVICPVAREAIGEQIGDGWPLRLPDSQQRRGVGHDLVMLRGPDTNAARAHLNHAHPAILMRLMLMRPILMRPMLMLSHLGHDRFLGVAGPRRVGRRERVGRIGLTSATGALLAGWSTSPLRSKSKPQHPCRPAERPRARPGRLPSP